MPGNDRFRLEDDERRTPARPQVQQPCPQEAVHLHESNAPALRLSVPVKKNISSAGLVDSGPVGGEAVQELYNSFYKR
jgi:hypothetical protein